MEESERWRDRDRSMGPTSVPDPASIFSIFLLNARMKDPTVVANSFKLALPDTPLLLNTDCDKEVRNTQHPCIGKSAS